MAKILIVDDRPNVLTTIASLLELEEHEAHKAHTVDDGIDALSTAKTNDTPYHVVLIDLRFDNYTGSDISPEIAGMKVLEAALEDPFIEPIIMTAFPSIETAQWSVNKGVFRYLIKGDGDAIPTDELLRTVNLAVAYRKLIKTLHISIAELKTVIQKLNPTNITTARNYAETCQLLAQQAYDQLLHARGRE